MNKPERIVYVNGEYLAETKASISIFDRGFLFADAVYEVTAVVNGKLLDNTSHLKRLKRSLHALNISIPLSDQQIISIQQTLLKENQLTEGLVYLQISRGAADRDFAIDQALKPTVVLFTQAKALVDSPLADRGLRVITLEDLRWKRCDIKTTSLLAASLAKQQALDAGVDDAWFVNHDEIKEGTSNNVFIITQNNELLTRHTDEQILSGITRAALLTLAKEQQLTIIERSFTLAEVYAAREAFITSAGTFVLGVVEVNQHRIADGKPGSLTQALRALYIQSALAAAD